MRRTKAQHPPPLRKFNFFVFANGLGNSFQLWRENLKERGAVMDKKEWVEIIRDQMTALDVTADHYTPAVETLADVLEQRDKTKAEFDKSGGKAVVEHTNKGGSTNMTKNPLLVLWDDLNKTALAYWRELGLTPSSYRKMTGDTPKKERVSSLAAALKEIER